MRAEIRGERGNWRLEYDEPLIGRVVIAESTRKAEIETMARDWRHFGDRTRANMIAERMEPADMALLLVETANDRDAIEADTAGQSEELARLELGVETLANQYDAAVDYANELLETVNEAWMASDEYSAASGPTGWRWADGEPWRTLQDLPKLSEIEAA